MVLAFLILSIALFTITFKVLRNQNYMDLKSDWVALTLGFIAFNFLFALLLLFDKLESNSYKLMQEFAYDPKAMSLMIVCLVNVLAYSVFTLLFMARSGQRNQKE
jgi:hypothetical protein